jgi:hypothetical protein
MALVSLNACTSLDNPGTNAMIVTVKGAFSPGADADEAPLRPGYGYLRVTYAGSLALFALGFSDHDQNGTINVYYGPDGSILKLQNGHVMTLRGTSTEWPAVRIFGRPDFNTVASAGSAGEQVLSRRRDVEPGALFDRDDHITIRPSVAEARAMKGIEPSVLRWFTEQSEDLPTGRLAVNSAGVPVYGEQWIDADHLLTWQLWPVSGIHPLP